MHTQNILHTAHANKLIKSNSVCGLEWAFHSTLIANLKNTRVEKQYMKLCKDFREHLSGISDDDEKDIELVNNEWLLNTFRAHVEHIENII